MVFPLGHVRIYRRLVCQKENGEGETTTRDQLIEELRIAVGGRWENTSIPQFMTIILDKLTELGWLREPVKIDGDLREKITQICQKELLAWCERPSGHVRRLVNCIIDTILALPEFTQAEELRAENERLLTQIGILQQLLRKIKLSAGLYVADISEKLGGAP